jgi:hypothetical protein
MHIRSHLRRGGLPAAFLFSSVCATAQVELYEKFGANGSKFGLVVARAGDLDRDGVPDFLVGAPQAVVGGVECGMAYSYSGLDGHLLFSYSTGIAGDNCGWSLSPAGDVDHDGWNEVLIGCPANDGDRGAVCLFSGKTGALLHSFHGVEPGSRFGSGIALIGKVDADSYPDFAISAPMETVGGQADWGMVRIYSGANVGLIREVTHSGSGSGWGFGLTLAGDCDWDGDGRGDLLIGSPFYSNGAPSRGLLQIYSGANNSVLRSWLGEADDRLGGAVAGLGDVDGDGLDDIAIASPFSDDNGYESGSVAVYGTQDPAMPIFVVDGEDGSRMGASLSRLGDVNGDGTPDLLVGWPGHSIPFLGALGKATVHSGVDGTVLESVIGAESDSLFGLDLARLGDLNGDGMDDYVVGAGLFDGIGSEMGQARVFLTGTSIPDVYCTAKTNSQGCEPRIGFQGAPSLSVGNNFEVIAWDVLNKTPGILIHSFTPDSKPFLGGTLCIGTPIVRTEVQFSGGSTQGNDCTGRYEFHFRQTYMAAHGFLAGKGVYCQYWSRDPGIAPPNNVGLTAGLHFVVQP